jgi:hypothetical protein
VVRGDRPQKPDGAQVVFGDYREAKPHLVERLGSYCSYCERFLPVSLAVEHKVPKSQDQTLEREWGNLLLGCPNCNSAKGCTPIRLTDYYWPDRQNTMLVVAYGAGGTIGWHVGLSDEQEQRAKRTVTLTGLDRRPGHLQWSRTDDRWLHRKTAWDLACRYLREYEAGALRPRHVADLMSERGFWSVWITVFAAHPEVRVGLTEALPGTARDCFDADGHPLPRPGGDL